MSDERFEKPWLLLCEGKGDRLFYQNLLKTHNCGDNFSIHSPERDGSGRSEFGRFLRTHSKDETFITSVKAILVVSDYDTDDSFAEVQRELGKAKEFPVPDSERVPKRQAGRPCVVVLMIPIGTKGNLESLCLPAAYSKWSLKDDLDRFVAKTPASEWSIGKQAKMRMQTILAATNKKRPDSGFASHFSSSDEYKIPLDHQCFGDIVSFIRGFGDLIGT
jgi:uncharacterized protein DUF3226